MKLFKRLALILSLILTTSVFAACSKDSSEETSTSVETQQSKSKKDKEKDNKDNSNKELSDDLFDYTISLDKKVYTLPVAFSDFAKDGWEGEGLDKKELEPNKYARETLKKGKKTINVVIANLGTDVLTYTECLVAGVEVDYSFNKNEAKLIISKGITKGDSYDKVIEAFGKPKDEYADDDYSSIKYESDTYSYYKITFNNKKVTEINVRNMVATEDSSKSNKAANMEVPDIVKNYKAPTSLGDDLNAFNVKFDGVLYKLPVPLMELEKNGWKLVSEADKIVPAKNSVYGVKLKKDDNTLLIEATNYSNSGAPLKYCFATTIRYSEYGCNVSLELPKGVTEKSTASQIIAAYGEPKNKHTSSDYTNYGYGDFGKMVTFSFRGDKLMTIDVDYEPKDLN